MYNIRMFPAYTLSDFLRASGSVIEQVDIQDVTLRRRDGSDLTLSTADRREAVQMTLSMLAKVLLIVSRETPDAIRSAFETVVPWTLLLSREERLQYGMEVARAAAEAVELGTGQQLVRVLSEWRDRGRRSPRRSSVESRPVVIPEDLVDSNVKKASGLVELPLHVRWSGPRRSYDLNDPKQLRLVYEQVLQEGTLQDIRRFIEVDKLVRHWDHLVLPRRVREAWREWFEQRNGS